MEPKLSVLMPFRNCEKFLDESIRSILNQSFTDFELILINDASTDSSDAVAKKYLDDRRLVYICNTTNLGIAKNLNHGLRLARADIVARMDGDDVSAQDRFQKQFDFLCSNTHISFVGSFAKIIDENSQQIDVRTKPTDEKFISENIILYNPLIHPSVMFRKSAVLSLGGYSDEFGKNEDQNLWINAVYSNFLISNIPEFLINYRYHSLSTSHDSTRNAVNTFRLRVSSLKRYEVKVSPLVWVNILGQLIVGVLFSGRQRQWIEGMCKKVMYGQK